MKVMLIGLCGKAGAGKDSAAAALAQKYGLERYAFAGPIKAALQAMLDIPYGKLDDRKYKEEIIPWLGKSPRQMLQTLGTEWGREMVHPDIWLNLMVQRWKAVNALALPGMVVSDVRFPNEAEKIRRLGGYLIQIVRPEVATVASHVSESGIDPRLIDETVYNDGTLGDLKIRISGTFVYLRSAGGTVDGLE